MVFAGHTREATVLGRHQWVCYGVAGVMLAVVGAVTGESFVLWQIRGYCWGKESWFGAVLGAVVEVIVVGYMCYGSHFCFPAAARADVACNICKKLCVGDQNIFLWESYRHCDSSALSVSARMLPLLPDLDNLTHRQ